MINFCFETIGNHNIGYPNLAKRGLGATEFDQCWPFATPFRIQMYLSEAQIPYNVFLVQDAPTGSWYPISLGWHSFDCDYFSLLSDLVKFRLKQQHIKLLFYYHEGDNPIRIKDRFDQLCQLHQLPSNCYQFVSANSSSDLLENFFYFSDHESFFKYLNRNQPKTTIFKKSRNYVFTAVNRSHKWWRASCMSQLKSARLLDNSLWSYNSNCQVGDQIKDNPIIMNDHEQQIMLDFVANGPYFCDSDDSAAHNDHRYVVDHLYTHSYCHLVLETLFDADQSGGAFITEKTYKCIKFGQPFVIAGAPHSLKSLQNDGYRTFDHVIDNSYDSIEDNNLRWAAIKRTLEQIKQQDLYQWYVKCIPDLVHNQQVFMQQKTPALIKLVAQLTADWNSV